nr:MAG TPA: hypothetical protein [Caudoviricetes sp.]
MYIQRKVNTYFQKSFSSIQIITNIQFSRFTIK